MEEEEPETEPLVTMAEMAERFHLSRLEVRLIQAANWHHARVRPRGAHLYPESVVVRAIKRRWPERTSVGTPLGAGAFPPASELEWCTCGRAWLDRAALMRHVEQDHHNQLPAQVAEVPHLTAYWNELAIRDDTEVKTKPT